MKKDERKEFASFIHEKIKEHKKNTGMHFYEVAEKLGITRQNLREIVKAKVGIKVETVMELSKILNYNLFQYYTKPTNYDDHIIKSTEEQAQSKADTTQYTKEEADAKRKQIAAIEKEIEYLREKIDIQENEIANLKKINQLQEKLLKIDNQD